MKNWLDFPFIEPVLGGSIIIESQVPQLMKVFMKTFCLVLLMMCFSLTAFAQSKVAVVKILKGDVEVLTLGKTTKLKVDDWVEAGAVVKTGEKSFVKLVFLDKSTMNISPKSEMKIENFSGKDSGVIDLVKGQIRSQVTKDYLQMDPKKSKMFVKTPNAVMGIRGTDFTINYDGKNTSAALHEGSVVFNKLDDRSITSSDALEAIVDRGVAIRPGQISIVDPGMDRPTAPTNMSEQDKRKFEKDDVSANSKSSRSVVPEGLSGKIVDNKPDAIKEFVPTDSGAAAGESIADGPIASPRSPSSDPAPAPSLSKSPISDIPLPTSPQIFGPTSNPLKEMIQQEAASGTNTRTTIIVDPY